MMKAEYNFIANIIEKNSTVLDVGCDDGTLMEFLRKNKNVNIRGIEISKEKVQICIDKGLKVIEGNAVDNTASLQNPEVLDFYKNILMRTKI